MYFGILGPLELRTESGLRTPRGPKLRKILALLILRSNQIVEIDSLVEELWDGDPPRTAVNTLRTHLYHLRGILELESSAATTKEMLVTRPSGYLLHVEENQLDLPRFIQLSDQGRALLRSGRVDEAADTLGLALAQWRGRCLADMPHGRILAAHVSRLTELHISALELRIEADLHLGRHRELIAELRNLTMTHPLNEWFHARLITALHRSGRRGEALLACRALRQILNEELGVEPSPEVQRLQADIVAGHDDRSHLASGPVSIVRAAS